MANLSAATSAGVIPAMVIVTTTVLGATAPMLEIVNSHAARFSPDEVVISIGGHTSVLPLKVTPGIDEVSWRVSPLSAKTWEPAPSVGPDAATPAPMRTTARASMTRGAASFRTIALPWDSEIDCRELSASIRHRLRAAAQGTYGYPAYPVAWCRA
jgi:hypothetical protein